MQRSLLVVLWVLSLAIGVINVDVNGVCQLSESTSPCSSDSDFRDGQLQIVDCTSHVATATFTSVRDQTELDGVEVLQIYWICESESGEDVYYNECETRNGIRLENDLDISLNNISGNGQPGSKCYIEMCVVVEFGTPRRIQSNKCVIPGGMITTTQNVSTVATEIASTTAAEIASTTVAEIASTTAAETTTTVELITSTAAGKQMESTSESGSDIWTSVLGIKEETQRSDTVMISIVTSVMVLVLILVIVMVLVVIIITQLQTRKFYHHSWLSCGKPELPFDPHYAPVDIESPSFISTNRTSLLSMDNMFQTLCLDPPKGSLYIDKVSTRKSLLDISGNCSNSCVTLNAADRELNEDNESASINIGKDSIGSVSRDISKPYVPLNGETLRAFSNATSISLLKSDGSSYLPSSTSYVQHQPTENKPDLQSLPNKGDVDFDDYDDLLSPRTDIIDFPGELDCSHPFPLSHGFEVQSCGSVGTQNFTFEVDNNSSPEDDLMLVPGLPHPISGQSAPWKDEAVQLDSHYVSSESGYVQSRNTQFSSDITECLFHEENEHLDTDLFTDHELTEEDGEQCTQLLAVGQSLAPPTCLFDIEDTTPSVELENCGTEQTSDTGKEVDMLTSHEPNTHCYLDHSDYIAEECPLSATSPVSYTPKSNSVGYVPGVFGDLSGQSNIPSLNYIPSDVSSEYIMSGVSSDDSKQQIPMDMLQLRRLNDVEEEIGGFDLTFSFDEQ